MNDSPAAASKDYVSAQDAVRLLDVRMQTLYAYVSRGWVRSITQPGRKERLYARADIEKMQARSLARSGHGAVAASAMHWGEPIIPTSITPDHIERAALPRPAGNAACAQQHSLRGGGRIAVERRTGYAGVALAAL
jgi:hypothetical protein